MDAKDFLISVSELNTAMKDAHIHAIATALVAKKREELETMLPAFNYKNEEERQSAIEQLLIAYEWGVEDGIKEWVKHQGDF